MTPLLPGLVLGFPQYTEGSGQGVDQGPSRRKAAPADVTASMLGKPMDISQPPIDHHPRRFKVLHPTCRPPACATMVLAILVISPWLQTRGLEDKKWDIETTDSSIAAELEGTSSTIISVADRTRQQGHTMPLLARPGPNMPAKTPPPGLPSQQGCHHHQFAVAPPPPPMIPCRARRLAGPPRPKWGLKWASIWAKRVPLATYATTSPCGQRSRHRSEAHPLARPNHRARPRPADPHRRREEVTPEPPPRTQGKAVCRHQCHQGFSRRLLQAAAQGKEEEGGLSGREAAALPCLGEGGRRARGRSGIILQEGSFYCSPV
jgi:hypothetical protein